MKKIIFANWKCNKSVHEMREWILEVGPQINEEDNFRVVVCVPSVYLSEAVQMVSDAGYLLEVGAQDVSMKEKGAFTGEVSALMLESIGVKWALIGHSERRVNFGETNESVSEKVAQCRKFGIEPVVLIRGLEDVIPEQVSYFGWEPVAAIGTGQSIDPVEANRVVSGLKAGKVMHGMYGGSVDTGNIKTYFEQESIEGAVIGSASLVGEKFIQLLNEIR